MKAIFFFPVLTGLAGVATSTLAQTLSPTTFNGGDFLVRFVIEAIIPEDVSSSATLLGSDALAGSKLHVSDYVSPGLEFSYFFSPHWAIEIIPGLTHHRAGATTPLGDVKAGTTWVFSPIVTAQYHFSGISGFVPFVGAGFNASIFFDTKAAGGFVDALHFDNAIGPVIEVGFDYMISRNWYANFSVKQSFIKAKASINHGEIIGKDDVFPTVIGAGIGYRF